jgi:sugar phosphate isomerase/epimerase
MTTKPWSLAQAVPAYEAAGVAGITVWRQHVEEIGISEASAILADSSLDVVSLCRGGFFPAESADLREAAIVENLKALEEAQAIGAPLLVLVCGAVPGMPLDIARDQIRDGIEAILPKAIEAGVRLAVEPLHPMYADDRSAVCTLRQANDLVKRIGHPDVGVTLDVYHVWWDDTLPEEIVRAGDRIFSFHVCDWRTPTRDQLNDRAVMGEGCIDIRQLREWVEAAGFDGKIEVEIFSDELWALDQNEFLDRIKQAYIECV